MAFPIAQLPQDWQVPDRVDLTPDDLWLVGRCDPRDAHAPRIISAYEGLLDDFLQLANGSSEQIRDFALDRGLLGICKHGWPAEWEHRRRDVVGGQVVDCHPIPVPTGEVRDDIAINETGASREPIARWRYLSEVLSSLLRAAEAIEAGSDLEWEVIEGLSQLQMLPFDVPPPPLGGSSKTGERQHSRWIFRTAADEFVRRAVRLSMVFPTTDAHRLHLRYRGSSLADALAVQTAVTIARAGSAFTCDGCGAIFIPSRTPRYGSDKFCESCRAAKVPQKRADARRRQKVRDQRREVQDG